MHPLLLRAIFGGSLLIPALIAQTDESPARDTKRTTKANVPGRVSPSIFEDGPPPAQPKQVKKTEEAPAKSAQPPAEAPVNPPPVSQPPIPTVERVTTPPLPLKDVKPEDFALVKPGFTVKEMEAVLGPPASRVAIPEDDGSLRETCQFWGNGKLLGIVRLDNGRVVAVDVRK